MRNEICIYLSPSNRARLERLVADRNTPSLYGAPRSCSLPPTGWAPAPSCGALASRSRASGAGRSAISMRACLACCATRRDPRALQTAFGEREEAGHHREDGNRKPRPRYALERAQDGEGDRRQSSQRAASTGRGWSQAASGRALSRCRTTRTSPPRLSMFVGLYMNPPTRPCVLCVDEKSQIQALDRTQPGLPMKKGRARR